MNILRRGPYVYVPGALLVPRVAQAVEVNGKVSPAKLKSAETLRFSPCVSGKEFDPLEK